MPRMDRLADDGGAAEVKPFDKAQSRFNALSPTVIQTVKSFSSAAGKVLEVDVPLLLRVALAAARLNKALAQGRLTESYEAQGELNKLIEESLQ